MYWDKDILYCTLSQLTSDFVPDEFAGFHLSDWGEEGADLLLRHRLRQIVDNEVRLALLQAIVRAIVRGASRAGHVHPAAHVHPVDWPIGLWRCGRHVHPVLHTFTLLQLNFRDFFFCQQRFFSLGLREGFPGIGKSQLLITVMKYLLCDVVCEEGGSWVYISWD